MSDVAIRSVDLGKRYRIGSRARYKALRDTIADSVKSPLRATLAWAKGRRVAPLTSRADLFWALRHVDFEIKQGEAVGIIGRNGAGKSTLLKVLAQVTEPTEGYAEIFGRIGSLLEVGVGFHPELTGRENIYLNGAILGMHKAEIDHNFDEIVAFAEVEKFLETPVKHFSSGMYVRLGFSVAAHLQTEILFVDEVLSVGDAAFQEKCLGKMRNAARGGRTVVFVSHNLISIQALCQRAIWLDKGQVIAEGRPGPIVARYLENVRNSRTQIRYENPADAPRNGDIYLRAASIRAADANGSDAITVRTPLRFEFELWNSKPGTRLDFGFNLYNDYGILVLNTGTVDCRAYPEGLIRMWGQIPGDLLNAGTHRIEFLVVSSVGETTLICPDLLAFEVADSLDLRGVYHGEWPGAVRPNIPWTADILD